MRQTRQLLPNAFRMFCICLLGVGLAAQAQFDAVSGSATETGGWGVQEFLPVEEAYQVEVDVTDTELLLLWNIAPGYYLYKERFQLQASSEGQPLALAPVYREGKVKYDDYFEKELEVFYTSTDITAALPQPVPATFELTVTSQGCADAGLCYPPQKAHFRIDLADGSVTSFTPVATQADTTPGSAGGAGAAAPAGSDAFLPYILLLAIAGGAILNLMPCVFPVLSIKALSLASAGESPQHLRLHGWAFTAGVVMAFLAVAAAMLATRAGGQAVGWGFQLQSPLFISFLVYLFFIMGLSLSGMINFGTRLMGVGQSLTQGSGLRPSFFTGVLAAVVASPCTAPLMGTAIGFAMTQTTAVALGVFAALGFGMALPFLLLSYAPRLATYLPAPGPWMETMKQALAFPLYLTAVWLLWVLGRQVGSDAVAFLSIGAVLVTFAFWLANQSLSSTIGRLLRGTAVTASLLGAAAIPLLGQSAGEEDHWEPYTPERLAELTAAGEPVLVNLTADWCITCLANEKIALNTERVNQALALNDIYTLKGDWTNYNSDITELLNRYGRNGVPLYLLFPARKGAEAEILPQLLTEALVLDAIERAALTQTAQN
ncbi:protein-disulfide reductase DsbD [Exilibacterium tricleocarpae]|uniref:Protein-disulfide reductase DsbD n=1 Tax=Exilibacterium tricleocarpae TaxID=2591008 RepID=A0A545T3F8_9GAMM|nr:protein-disulfide reductase DsbD [Exilibacterium tricleocarpae]TQV71725.1 protein-disulfide reductase DsbD [Exilibacterium tricleocarpae]